ncbi:MAG TPA: histidine kinase dimerization/phosphoacceptor domain -containing protein, partial [Candidatus Ozemobacteraceae bacterium]|nr:histidine kinase dimerization/phosphoacceptor domain -containing protein [Candidatus Ozemobacteraceae bacterium]
TRFEPLELLIRCRDETIRTVMGSAAPLGGSFVGAHLIILYDITERKRGEQMEQSLREKEMLLKEIHHRVKNNLAVVSSLLSLQAKNKDAAVRALLEEGQQRVKSMALVHEKLYQTKNVSAVNFDEYVRTIISEIMSLYQIDTRVIATEINIENIQLDLETAIPCGLLINELLTNAFKYAFPDNRHGTLRIHFTQSQGIYSLLVQDDGIGLPSGFNPETSSTLGLELVHVLAGQLGGELKLTSTGGVRAEVLFRRRRK